MNSLQAGNAGIGNAAQTATDTAQQIGSLVKENQQQLRGIKGSFEQNVLPGLNTSLDSFGQLSGKLSGVLSGVDPLVDQTKGILDNLNTSLNDSKTQLAVSKQLTQPPYPDPTICGRLAVITCFFSALGLIVVVWILLLQEATRAHSFELSGIA